MTISLTLWLALAALQGDDPAPAAATARAVLKGCGPVAETLARLPDASWAPRPSALDDHKALRSALHAPMPDAPTQIRFYANGGHLSDSWHSIVMVRDAAGVWTGTDVGRSRIWIEGAPMQPTPMQAWTVSDEDGRKIDAILADPCFYAEPTSGWYDIASGPPPRSAFTIRFETMTPKRSRQTSFLGGSAKGRTGELFALILPKRVP